MKFSIVFLGILLALVESTLSCRCDPNYDSPVCASDGKTYKNPCSVSCGPNWPGQPGDKCLTVIYEGECTTPCNCQDVCDSQCGSDGKTYGNICSLDCAKLKYPGLAVDHAGIC